MLVNLQKSPLLWMKSYIHFPIAWLGWPYIYTLYLTPERLTPFYSGKVPYFFILITIVSIVGVIFFLFFLLLKPKDISIDFSEGEVKISGKRDFKFDAGNAASVQTHSYKNDFWYTLFVTRNTGISTYATPKGYKADVAYSELADYLEKSNRSFFISHSPWLFKQSQKEEDRMRNDRVSKSE